MALMTCEDCKKKISTIAVSCPNCGRPNTNAGIVTIEQTQKKWKQWDLISLFLFIPGGFYVFVYTAIFGTAQKHEPIFMLFFFIATAMTVIGVTIGIASGIGRWYHHG